MLTMRMLFALSVCALTILISASNSYPQPQPKAENKPTTQDKRGTQESPLIIQGEITTKAAEKPESDRKQEEEKIEIERSLAKYAGWTAAITGVLVLVTGVLAFVTYKLWRSTKDLVTDARNTATQQTKDMQTSLGIAKQSADVAVAASMPFLSPLIIGGVLHPFPTDAEVLYPSDQPRRFESSVLFISENFGKTPGIIREVRGDLFLCENDQFPTVDFGQLPIIEYYPIIAGDSRGQDSAMDVATCRREMIVSAIEFSELLAEAASGKYRRFAFIGRVIYDDFFDGRQTRRFCVKLRKRPGLDISQLMRGGKAYNHVERQQIPKDE